MARERRPLAFWNEPSKMIVAPVASPWAPQMLQQHEANPPNEHRLYLVLFITSAGGV
jgi:hypothetical protein